MSSNSDFFMNIRSSEYSGEETDHLSSILRRFKTKNFNEVKKDTFIIHIARSMKKTLKFLSKGVKPKQKPFRFDLNDHAQNKLWRSIDELYYQDVAFFKELSKIKPSSQGHKSYNQQFCFFFLSSELAKDAFDLFIEIMYYGCDPNTLMENFCLMCCNGNQHEEQCFEYWQRLKECLLNNFVSELRNSRENIGK